MSRKINVFSWLTWDNKILTLYNLAMRGCNNLPIATYILYHSAIEIVDHLFIDCAIIASV